MKKFLVILLCVCLLFLTACKKTELPPNTSMEYNSETDCQFTKMPAGRSSLAESPEGYYYISYEIGFLRFIDKATLEDIVVCGKPDCLHEKGDPEQCNAYFDTAPGGAASLCYYEGKLYLLANEYDPKNFSKGVSLMEVSLDGSKRKRAWKMNWETSDSFPNVQQMIIHRGVVYFSVFDTDTMDESPMQIYAYSLATKKCKRIADEYQGISYLTAVGDYLYFSAFDSDEMKSFYHRYTISTGETVALSKEYSALSFYQEGVLLRQTGDNFYFSADLAIEHPTETGRRFDRVVACSKDYVVEESVTIIHKESGREISNKEYNEALDAFYAVTYSSEEEKYAAYVVFLDQYQRTNSGKVSVWDANTWELLGETVIPCGNRGVNFFDGNILICSDQNFGELHRIDISKLGTADFVWESSKK